MDSRVAVVSAEFRHINVIANRLRAIDREECAAMGRTAKQALRLGLATSGKAWTALVDGKPEAMFGVVVEDLINGRGTPWFLGTDEVYRHGRELLMWGPGFVSRLGDSLRRLDNLVSARNRQAIRLLARWGFTVEEEDIMVRDVAFRRFSKVMA
ncbi:hypothetical protein [Novosphingobium sp. PY1]|uniref:N-acetyltransferase domain-containing protein n=1 Tax=Ochrobactrum sp. PW1 TaxID=1882222 RepID=A0A292GMP2_9HYPH|nr:hypothetical protein [Novosphingobium sp. PY1]BBA74424.1 hypothetical protein [Ochrobactrum sp. PW1]GFM29273.1 uncharacterized protein PY1_contig-07-199 [Novosphingobium sp. PY1]